MKTLFPSAYFGPVEYWAAWIQSEKTVLEIHENYRKQTYRSRACIATGNGILPLNIPVRHTGNASTGRMKMEQAATSVEFRWAREHFRSLETAYRTSPYFEFYEDMFRELYFGDVSSLLDFNIRAHKLVCRLLGIDDHVEITPAYEGSPADTADLRMAFSPKTIPATRFEPYTQVFVTKHGFLPNLSILDLLFCCGGRDALEYLKNVELILP